jgi:5,10-methylenetetrahydrofolate reductase
MSLESQQFSYFNALPGIRPLICLEVNPPRGVDVEAILERIEGKLEGIDLLNITDCALARMKLAGIPFASILKRRLGKEVVVNLSCRDRNLIALQADLLAAWALEVRSIVALTGDAMTIGDYPEGKAVFEVNSIGLLNLIKTLNGGKDFSGNELRGAPAITPGVVVNPNARNVAVELKRLKRKKDAGAQYALSQPVFDLEAARAFLTEAQAVGVPILLGLLALKSVKAAESISQVPGIRMSEELLTQVRGLGEGDLSDFFVTHALMLAGELAPLVHGFHVISGTAPLLALRLARELVAKFMQ